MAKPPPPVGTIVNGHRFMGGDPAADVSWQPLTGEDYLKTVDPATAAQVRAIANGDMAFPTGKSAASPYWQAMLGHVFRYDPAASATNLPERVKARIAFNSGAFGQSATAIKTALAHLTELSDNYEKIGNFGPDSLDHGATGSGANPLNWLPGANNVAAHAIATTTGSNARYNAFNLSRQGVAEEMARAFKGGVPDQGEIETFKGAFDSSASPDAFRGSTREAARMLNARLLQVEDAYKRAMGTTSGGYMVLSPQEQDEFNQFMQQGYLKRAPSHAATGVPATTAHPAPPANPLAGGAPASAAPVAAPAPPVNRLAGVAPPTTQAPDFSKMTDEQLHALVAAGH